MFIVLFEATVFNTPSRVLNASRGMRPKRLQRKAASRADILECWAASLAAYTISELVGIALERHQKTLDECLAMAANDLATIAQKPDEPKRVRLAAIEGLRAMVSINAVALSLVSARLPEIRAATTDNLQIQTVVDGHIAELEVGGRRPERHGQGMGAKDAVFG